MRGAKVQGQNHVRPVTVKNPPVTIKYSVPIFTHTSLSSEQVEHIPAKVRSHTVPERLQMARHH